jgi:hypothetical protein
VQSTQNEFKEESPYLPATTLLCKRSRSKNEIALIIAPKKLQTQAQNELITKEISC